MCDALINSVDLLPTMLDLAGLEPAADLPGRSQADWCRTGRGERQRDVLLELLDWRALYDGRWCYALRYRGEEVQPIHLIEAQADPHDLHNLISDPAVEGVRHKAHDRLIERLCEAGDREFLSATGLW